MKRIKKLLHNHRFLIFFLIGSTALYWFVQYFHWTALTDTQEPDFFGHFVVKAKSLASVFTIDPFYPFGYPLLLRLGSLIIPNRYLLGKWINYLSLLLLLSATYWYCKKNSSIKNAQITSILMVSSLLLLESLFMGTDVLWNVLVFLGIILLVEYQKYPKLHLILASAITLGAGCLIRHPAFVIFITCLFWLLATQKQKKWHHLALFAITVLLINTPQFVLSTAQTGSPFYNNQAKNLWFFAYGDREWSENWDTIADNENSQAILKKIDPIAVAKNWTTNIAIFLGFPFFLLIPAFVYVLKKQKERRFWLPWVILAILALNLSFFVIYRRFFLFFYPFYLSSLVEVANLLLTRFTKHRKLLAISGVGILFIATTTYTFGFLYLKQPSQEIVELLKTTYKEKTTIATCSFFTGGTNFSLIGQGIRKDFFIITNNTSPESVTDFLKNSSTSLVITDDSCRRKEKFEQLKTRFNWKLEQQLNDLYETRIYSVE